MRKILLLVILLLSFNIIWSQDFSNKGKDFWLGYGFHVSMAGTNGVPLATGGSQEMVLYLTSDVNANVTVEIPSVGYTQNYTIVANQVTTTLPFPKTGAQDARIADSGYFNRGIHIISDVPVVAYAHIYNSSISGAALLFPTNTLGQQYYCINYNQNSNQAFSNGFFFVVGTEDNTTVEITPSAANKNGKTPNVPFNVTLNKGQIYCVMGTTTGNVGTDLTGSKIRSVNTGTSGCKRIAVYNGCGKISIGTTTPGGSATPSGSADNLFAQAFPSNAWGRRYLTSPTTSQPNNFYRVCVSDPTTIVKLNGVIIPSTSLINGFYYQFRNSSASITTSSAQPNLIEADKAILVAQYCTTQGMEGNPNVTGTGGNGIGGDPEMIYLSPVEQTINKITLFSAKQFNILQSYINVIIKTGGVASFRLDGVAMASSFITHPQDPNYRYASFPVTSNASHSLYSDTGFNAIAYGFGSAESYGYNAGTNVVDLYQYVSIQNQYSSVNFPSTCQGTPFKFSITLPYQPISLVWDFNNNANISPSSSVTILPPTGQTVIPADSTFIRDGRTLYLYKLPAFYTFNAAGVFQIKVKSNNPTPDGCSGEQEIAYDVQVFERPKADFTFTTTGCVTNPINFFDATNGFGRPTIKWNWEFGDATVDSVINPIKTYLSPGTGTYNVKLTTITDIGCISDTTKPLAITSVPNAKFGISDTTCVGKTIVFTDSSTIAVGNIVKWYWNYGNGNTDTLTSNTIPRSQTYSTAGPYTVTLITESNTGCRSILFSKLINVRDNPVPSFSLPIVCLPVGAASFANLTTIPDGTIGTVTYTWNFGNSITSTSTTGVTNYTSTGPFTVQLIAASQYGCVKDSTKTLSTVYAAPISSFTLTSEVCLRDSATLTSTGNPGSGNSITNWYWNRDFIAGASYVDTLDTYKYRYGIAKTYTVKMYFKTDKGCISDTSTNTIIVNPLPSAAFINTALLCEKNNVTFTTQSVPNVGNITRWHWNMGNAVINNFTNNNPFSLAYTTWGNYTIKHLVETNKGCKSDTAFKTLSINPLPRVGYVIPEVCLADAAAVFIDTTSIPDGTQATFTYNWNFNLTGVSPAPLPPTSIIKNGTTKYNKSDNYQVKLIVQSGAGCRDSLSQAFTVNGSIPKADFAVLKPTQLCSNIAAEIQNTSTVDFGWLTKVEIYWDYLNNPTQKVLDDTPNVGEIYNHLYPNFQQPATKTYTVRFVAYSGGTCVDIKTRTITINASPKVQFNTMPGICFDASPRQITQATEIGNVTGSASPISYFGTGVNTSGLFSPAIAGAGTFPIKYVYTSNIGCQDSLTKSITVWPSPTAKFGISSPICEKNDLTFTDSSAANYSNIVKWDYVFDDGTTLIRTNANSFIKKYTSPNSYNVTLKVTTDSGCISPIFNKLTKVNYLPLVSFTIPKVCLPDGRGQFNSTSLIPDSTQNQFSYAWNFGDGGTNTIKSPIHQYSLVGPFTVKLKVTSIDGCVDSLSRLNNTIYPQPKANFTINPSTKDVCLGRQFGFTDVSTSDSGSIVSWNWNYGDGSVLGNLRNPLYTYATADTFNVRLFVYDSKGCISDTQKIKVNVHALPVAKWGFTSPTCEKNAISFSDTSIANFNSISFWNWDFGDGTTLTTQNNASFNKTYAAFGNYTVTLRVTSDTGCISLPEQKTLIVRPLPLLSFSLPDICLPDGNGTFNNFSTIPDNSEALFSYLWDFGDPANTTTSLLKNPTHQYTSLAPTGGYLVKLKITTKDGCIDSLTQPFNKIYPQPKAEYSLNPSNGQVCIRDTLYFTDLSNGRTSAVNTWKWNFGDNSTSNLQNPYNVYRDTGSYVASLVIFNQQGCISDTFRFPTPIIVHPYPKLNAGLDLFVLEGGTIQIKPTFYATSPSFLWTTNTFPLKYLDFDTVPYPKSTPPDDITYTVKLTGIGGCFVTDDVFIKVLKAPLIPNAFSPNGDGINDIWEIKYLESYPGATIEVFDRSGRMVYNSINNSTIWNGTLNGKPLPVATYYYIVNPKNGRKVISGSVTIIK